MIRLIDIVRKGQHRLFVIGVGVAPGENLLRRLAEETGGVCEMVSPTEDMDEVVSRMLSRMRLAQLSDLAVDWTVHPVWHSPIPKNAYLGESITIRVIFNQAPMTPFSLRCKLDDDVIKVNADSRFVKDDGKIAKAVVDSQCKLLNDIDERTELAVKYSLISENTNLILVHERAEGEKAEGMPVLKQVPQMMVENELCCMRSASPCEPSDLRVITEHLCMRCEPCGSPKALEDIADWEPENTSFEALIDDLNYWDFGTPEDAAGFIAGLYNEFVDALNQSGFDVKQQPEIAVAVFIRWLIDEQMGHINREPNDFAKRTLVNIAPMKIEKAKVALSEAWKQIQSSF